MRRRSRSEIVGDVLRLLKDGKGRYTQIRFLATYTHQTTIEIMRILVQAGAVLWLPEKRHWVITAKGRELLQNIEDVEAALGREL